MTDPRLEPVLQASLSRIQVAMAEAVDKAGGQIGLLATTSTSNAQRQLLMTAEFDLQRKTSALNQAFMVELRKRVNKDSKRKAVVGAAYAETDWDALSLVDNAEVERNVVAERLAQSLGQECESEFKAVHDHLSPLLDDSLAEHNPLRPQTVSGALLEALTEVSTDPEVTTLLAQQIGRHLAIGLKNSYEMTVKELRSQGVRPVDLVSASKFRASIQGGRTTSPGSLSGAPPTQPGAFNDTAPQGHSQHGGQHNSGSTPLQAHQRAAMALSEMFGVSMPASAFNTPPWGAHSWMGGRPTGGGGAVQAGGAAGEFNALIRRLNSVPYLQGWGGVDAGSVASAADFAGTIPGVPIDGAAQGGFAGPMMAVNMIRAHREELVRASGGAALDQMVIDIVAALFDQVLSDPKVSPQMARQIARLQLPVLRVALHDMGFFSSRKHPVRRLVNRIASLSAAFDDHEQGVGQAYLAKITSLVDDVVEGDFDSMPLYEAKLTELEAFIDEQNRQESFENAAVAALLSGKEADLRVQQRYMQVLKKELADVEMPAFVRDFLTQIWSQVQVMASARDGVHSVMAQRVKKAGHNLALSVQPKGSPQLRKEFLMKLPQLMKDLNEGLALIQWSEEAKQDFFSKLLPSHAESLKAQPQHDLTVRMLEAQLSKVEKINIPSREEAANDPLPASLDNIAEIPTLTVVTALSADEIKQAGFMPEASLANEPLDIDLDATGPSDPSLLDIDINLDAPPVPSAGAQLVHHINKGTAYQMQMQGEWKRVRLTWISEGRSFFIFTQGHQHKQTISLTSRTLAKMCDSGRFKAFEQSELIERATMRARRQLAALAGNKSAA
ncbi:DUF1631 family protein [Aquabacterium sp.]|uniref:DUF1631 family protein n=1 Tax=Aquabacterium sp. TaxID=1872578 RepID=UPI00198EF75A|nr:DUF1631 family protein [Aquabacterium sp.]MBC7701359.1 DUF1631 family protein [Aquabacterium sp.]